MMRPRLSLLDIVADYKRALFPPSGVVPHPMLSVNVRHSDKKGACPSCEVRVSLFRSPCVCKYPHLTAPRRGAYVLMEVLHGRDHQVGLA